MSAVSMGYPLCVLAYVNVRRLNTFKYQVTLVKLALHPAIVSLI